MWTVCASLLRGWRGSKQIYLDGFSVNRRHVERLYILDAVQVGMQVGMNSVLVDGHHGQHVGPDAHCLQMLQKLQPSSQIGRVGASAVCIPRNVRHALLSRRSGAVVDHVAIWSAVWLKLLVCVTHP